MDDFRATDPKEVMTLEWEKAEDSIAKKIKLKIFNQIWPVGLGIIFVSVVIFLFDLMFLLPLFSNDNSWSTKLFVLFFLLALNALLIYGLRILIKDTFQNIGIIFKKDVFTIKGECIKINTKKIKFRGRNALSVSYYFAVGNHVIRRSIKKRVTVGEKYIFVKPTNAYGEIVYFPLDKIQKNN